MMSHGRALFMMLLMGSPWVVCGALLPACTMPNIPPNEMTEPEPEPEPFDGIEPSTTSRAPYVSQCALYAGLCTSSFPQAVISVSATGDQDITLTQDPVGFIVEGTDGDGGEVLKLEGSSSVPGDTANQIAFSWSSSADDDDPCTYAEGEVFSEQADPQVALASGVHYVRLTVRSNVPLTADQLPETYTTECGDTIGEEFKFDFAEVVIDIRD